ncbi:MAG: ABC-type transport auxiliary lipoprotein family protein [Verrucomicrobia bacterium]|nr:ABC-type transport auxiliary lipoprotein family protein [Verrucomicrobiota bacterium]
MTRLCILLTALLTLPGCIVFDKKSEAVAFYQFSSPQAAAAKSDPVVFVTRASIPPALRRPNLVMLDDAGWVRIEDSHRWVAPLDRLISEAIANHLASINGISTTLLAPPADHLVLLVTVERMAVQAPKDATLRIHFRLENSAGEVIREKTSAWSTVMDSPNSAEFVRAQSKNLANAAHDISTWIRPSVTPTPPKQP